MNPTKSDIAAAIELGATRHCLSFALVDEFADIIAKHRQRERKLLCELANMECTCNEAKCLSCRARQWKKENGL